MDEGEEAIWVDYVMHFISMPWKVFCAIIPPKTFLGAYPTFICSILWIAGMSAVIEQVRPSYITLANQFWSKFIHTQVCLEIWVWLVLVQKNSEKLHEVSVVGSTRIFPNVRNCFEHTYSQLAKLVGCVINFRTAATGVTLVALGTSVPDTFASRTAAKQDEFADAAIGNITGKDMNMKKNVSHYS